MKLRVDLAVTVPKDIEHQELNEDAWAVDETVSKVALSDGASESYDSRTWATLLVKAYAADSAFSIEWLGKVLADYSSMVNYESLSWSKQAAFDRGSFATLLGLELAPNGDVEVLALGDSVAFHLRGDQLLSSFPYTLPEQFDARPLLLSTLAANNSFVGEAGFFGRNTSLSWGVEVDQQPVGSREPVLKRRLTLGGQPLNSTEKYSRVVATGSSLQAARLAVHRLGRLLNSCCGAFRPRH